MNNFTFSEIAFEQYMYWQKEDKKTLKKINKLLLDIQRNGSLKGIGKPEILKYGKGYSRRIDEKNRLIYDFDELNNIHIIACKGHYDES